MAHLTFVLLFGALALIIGFYFVRARTSRSALARSAGCGSLPERSCRDPILALDHMIQDLRLSQAHQGLPAGLALFRKYGPTYQTSTLFGTRIVTVETANVQSVYGTNSNDWGVQSSRLAAMDPFCGKGFITTDGVVWERSKALLRPSFHKHNISNFGDLRIPVEAFFKQLPQDDRTVDLRPLFSLLFFEAAKRFLIGQELLDDAETKSCPVDGLSFLEAFQKSMRGCGMRIMLGPLRSLVPSSMSVQHWKVVHRFIDYYTDLAIRHQDQSLQPESGVKGTDQAGHAFPQSLLQNLAMQTGDRVEIRNQLIQAMMAAQDTTAALMSNTIFLLVRERELWTRLQDEVASIDSNSLTVEDLRPLDLLRNTLNESLRLYPIFAALERTALRDTILPYGGGTDSKAPVFAPAGTNLLSHFYTIHRDQAVYGPDVEVFRPDRWNTISPSRWQYMPFGGGQRSCLGQHKAFTDASYLLIRILQTFKRIESRDDRPWAGDSRLSTWNANGCKVALRWK